jgi:hypothetical protein
MPKLKLPPKFVDVTQQKLGTTFVIVGAAAPPKREQPEKLESISPRASKES